MATNQETADNAKAQVGQLRDQVENILTDRVTPTLVNAANCVDNAARQGIDYTRAKADELSSRVRNQPLGAIALAAAVGYIAGRLR